MENKSLRDRCKVNTNIDTDTFVGVKAVNGDIAVSFPLGFHLSEDEKELRKDIILLLNTLSKNTSRRESEFNTDKPLHQTDLPIQAYLYIISDYYSRGYYKERETINTVSKRGKINWNKTVKTQHPFIQDDAIYYLDYVTKKQTINDNELITLIHEFCVYESFCKIGWLFSDYVPQKSKLDVHGKSKYYAAVVNKKLAQTFNDRNRQLFRNMLAVINYIGNDGDANSFRYGTSSFEYVWERMIDKAYGVKDKDKYFPKTRWILGAREYENAALEPDTIMTLKGTVYVLDAKYYKYGQTGYPGHLPESTSINKQITYGEYIAESGQFKDINGKVYNAFIMPYDSYGKTFHTEKDIHYLGSAISDWKSSDGTKPYEEVAGILLDVKSLMQNHSHSDDRIIKLAELIQESVNTNDG